MKISYKINEYIISNLRNQFISFIIDGNSNIVVKPYNASMQENDVFNKTYTASFDEMDKLTTFLVENRVGVSNQLGITGDITKVLSGKTKFIALAKEESDDNPVSRTDLYGRKLIRPNKFIINTIGDSYYKLNMSFTINMVDKSVLIDIHNLPNESITLPTTISDGLSNWFAYWFNNDAVYSRMNDVVRNRIVKFKGHHALSDVYITTTNTYGKILVVRYVNSLKSMVFTPGCDGAFSVYIGDNDQFEYMEYDKDISIDDPNEMLFRIKAYPKKYVFRAKADKDVFYDQFINWKYYTLKKLRSSSFYEEMFN